jgi:hypothetical protein
MRQFGRQRSVATDMATNLWGRLRSFNLGKGERLSRKFERARLRLADTIRNYRSKSADLRAETQFTAGSRLNYPGTQVPDGFFWGSFRCVRYCCHQCPRTYGNLPNFPILMRSASTAFTDREFEPLQAGTPCRTARARVIMLSCFAGIPRHLPTEIITDLAFKHSARFKYL